jgi:hypothetical protein
LFPDCKHQWRLLTVLLLLALLPVPLHAGQTVLTPSIALREEYNDNIFSLTSGRRGDFLTTLSPALTVSGSNERVTADLAGGLNQLWYAHNSSNDGLGYFLRGSGNYATGPRSALTADLGLTRDTSASSIDPATSLVTSSRTLHQNYRLGEKYRLSELVNSSLSLGLGRDDYDNPAYLGTRHYLASAQFEYDLGRYLSGTRLTQVLSGNRDATDRSRVDSLGATLGVSRDLSELWRCSLNGGARYTHSRFAVSGSPDWGSNEEVGAVGNLALSYQKDGLAGSLALSQDLISASGRSGATQRTFGSAALSQRFSPRLSGSLGASYTRNWSRAGQFGAGAIDERYRNLGGSLRYQFSDEPNPWALEAGYTNNHTDYRLFGTRMNQNIVMLRLTWQQPSFR